MTIETIGLLSPGEMGGAVGGALHDHGFDVVTCLAGRGEATRQRAERHGLRHVPDLATLLGEADIMLSIMPPEFGPATADAVAAAMTASGATPPFAECNAVAPETSRAMGLVIEAAGAHYIDGGIVGSPPGKSSMPTRFYVSGAHAALMDELDGKGIDIRQSGSEVGRGSAIKMCYAAVTKGTSALTAAVLTAAETLGISEELHAEFSDSLPDLFKRMERMVPALPAVSGRYIGEMKEIAKTMASTGVTPNFHVGATELYELLLETPFASESRETVDKSRTMAQSVEVFAKYLPVKPAAE
jgi:3-hydroxyisobutyrate dehydrogenase-like beta-hydroxyacid dehydrogenase